MIKNEEEREVRLLSAVLLSLSAIVENQLILEVDPERMRRSKYAMNHFHFSDSIEFQKEEKEKFAERREEHGAMRQTTQERCQMCHLRMAWWGQQG